MFSARLRASIAPALRAGIIGAEKPRRRAWLALATLHGDLATRFRVRIAIKPRDFWTLQRRIRVWLGSCLPVSTVDGHGNPAIDDR